MTDRTVIVRLQAVTSQFDAAMRASGRTVKDVSAEITQKSMVNKDAMTKVGTSATVMGGALFAGFALATNAAMGFDKQMSNVKAVSGATTGELDALRQAAIQAGQATVFSASESADAEAELAKAGVSVKDILSGGLVGSLNLAAAGQMGVAEAAEDAATAMSQFGLQGKDVPHIADLMAAAANAAQGEVSDMAIALKYVGPVAAQMGVSIEETTGTIAELAHSGILADQAGTGLRGMLLSLTSPSHSASEAMEDLGINVYDSTGKFVGFGGVAEQMRVTMKDLTAAERDEAFGRIFGNAQITAARVLYAGGGQAVSDWTNKVNDSGAAARIAATNMDNLAGDLEQLRGSIETALITTGEEGTGVLRHMTQAATDLVNAYTGLPGPVKGAGLAFAGVGGSALLAVGAFALVVPRIVETRNALRTLNAEMPATARGLTLATKGLAGFAAAFALVETASAFLSQSDAQLNGFVAEITAAAGPDVQDQIAALTIRLNELNEQRKGLFFDTGIPFTHSAKRDAADEADRVAAAIRTLQSEQKQQQSATEHSDAALKGWTADAYAAKNAAAATTDNVTDLKTAMDDLNKATLTLRGAQRGFQAALDDADDALKKNGKTLDIHTAKGRANADALDGIATAAADELVAMNDAGASVKELDRKHAKMREDLVKAAENFGMTKKAAQRYADSVLSIPAHVDTVADFIVSIKNEGESAKDYARSHPNANPRKKRAAGGWVGGFGGPTADDQLIYASTDEFVVNAGAARRNATLLEAINSGATLTSAAPSGGRAASRPSFTWNIDARGSQMTEGQFRRIAEDVADQSWREYLRELRAV